MFNTGYYLKQLVCCWLVSTFFYQTKLIFVSQMCCAGVRSNNYIKVCFIAVQTNQFRDNYNKRTVCSANNVEKTRWNTDNNDSKSLIQYNNVPLT